jgi:para-nitrobenzyl esterase
VTTPAPPVIDGKIVTASTDVAFRDGAAAHVPYIVGFNSQEESLLRWLPGADEKWLAGRGAQGEVLLKLYMAEGLDRPHALGKLWGEAAMAAPSRARARALSSSGGKVWLYRYGYVPDASQGKTTGAGHDAEMEMVFLNRDLRWTAPWSDADSAMARTINGYWVNFAKTGDPNGGGLPVWPAYTSSNDTLMGFGQNGAAPIQRFGKSRLDAIAAVGAGALKP